MNRFETVIKENNLAIEKRVDTLQVNIGKLCNLACTHCHVESSPLKVEENMNRETAEAVVRFMDQVEIKTLDLTGGAPELNPHFRYVVTEACKRNIQVMDRCNLTVLYEPGQEDTAQFLADNKVEIVASLPCYLQENVDKQRGKGTFDKSLEALQLLNKLGYGKEETGLKLNLVYNPVGPHLPPTQESLIGEYKARLLEDYGIVFNDLFTITNMPIKRYEKYLKAFDQYEEYVELLINSFNPKTVSSLMCINTLSVSWDGKLYDCDFNQALNMRVNGRDNGSKPTIFDVTTDELKRHEVLTADHCFACTAGSGSSCTGSLV